MKPMDVYDTATSTSDRAVMSRKFSSSGSSSAFIVVGVVVVAAAYATLLWTHISPYAAGADSSGYMNYTKLLIHGQLLAPVRSLPGFNPTDFGEMAYQPLGFRIRGDSGFMSPTYAVGLPLHLAAATLLVGVKNSVKLVNLLAALAAALLMYLSCRYLKLGRAWAVGATCVLCTCSFFLIQALVPMSDLLATTWALAALYAAMRSRERAAWTVLCGFAATIAVLVRPSNTLLVFPLIVAFGFNLRQYPLAVLGALPGGLLLSYINSRTFGTLPLWQSTGYSSPMEILNAFTFDPTKQFSVAYFSHNAWNFALWIVSYLGPLILFAPSFLLFPSLRARNHAIQATWFIALTLPYTFYRPVGDWWVSGRFFLPALPSLIMLAAAALECSWRLIKPTFSFGGAIGRNLNVTVKCVAVSLLLFLSVGWTAAASYRLSFIDLRGGQKIYPDTAYWVRAGLPRNSLIACMQFSGAIYYHTNFTIVRWDCIDTKKVATFVKNADAQNRPIYAVLWPFEVDDALRRLGGDWTKIAEIGNQGISVFQLVH
jgi:hypothetical protein